MLFIVKNGVSHVYLCAKHSFSLNSHVQPCICPKNRAIIIQEYPLVFFQT
jgi:hypothetical protein